MVPPTFVYTCYGGLKEMKICNGLNDYFTCTLGTCIRLSDRPDWPIDWWERVDPIQFGGMGLCADVFIRVRAREQETKRARDRRRQTQTERQGGREAGR